MTIFISVKASHYDFQVSKCDSSSPLCFFHSITRGLEFLLLCFPLRQDTEYKNKNREERPWLCVISLLRPLLRSHWSVPLPSSLCLPRVHPPQRQATAAWTASFVLWRNRGVQSLNTTPFQVFIYFILVKLCQHFFIIQVKWQSLTSSSLLSGTLSDSGRNSMSSLPTHSTSGSLSASTGPVSHSDGSSAPANSLGKAAQPSLPSWVKGNSPNLDSSYRTPLNTDGFATKANGDAGSPFPADKSSPLSETAGGIRSPLTTDESLIERLEQRLLERETELQELQVSSCHTTTNKTVLLIKIMASSVVRQCKCLRVFFSIRICSPYNRGVLRRRKQTPASSSMRDRGTAPRRWRGWSSDAPLSYDKCRKWLRKPSKRSSCRSASSRSVQYAFYYQCPVGLVWL